MVKNLPANAGDIRDVGLISGWGRSPGGGHGNPLQCSCLENPMNRGTWRATVHRFKKSQTQLKQLSMHGCRHATWPNGERDGRRREAKHDAEIGKKPPVHFLFGLLRLRQGWAGGKKSFHVVITEVWEILVLKWESSYAWMWLKSYYYPKVALKLWDQQEFMQMQGGNDAQSLKGWGGEARKKKYFLLTLYQLRLFNY